VRLAIWIHIQQQTLKNQQDNIDLRLKKESETTLFTDKILQQVNNLEEPDRDPILPAEGLTAARTNHQFDRKLKR
jgi:hypothetical protein